MPRPILTAAAMRAAEQAAVARDASFSALMERAGALVADAAWRYAAGAPTLILCGPGNNGGDGYIAARHLAQRGVDVRIAASAPPTTELAIAARAAWGGPVEPLADADPAPLLIDCLFGTGLTRGLEDPTRDALLPLAAAARHCIAVDLPSGIATDDGAILSAAPTFDVTLALGALKPAHLLQPAARHMGRILVADIGLGPITSDLIEVERPRLRAPGPDDNKYSRGYVAVVGGAMPGAAALSATAAQRAGAGYVLLVGDRSDSPQALVHKAAPDAASLADILADRRIDAVVVGPGLGRDRVARQRLDAALSCGHPLVIDADALFLLGDGGLGRIRRLAAMPVMTPHEGEFLRLFGRLVGSKVERARAAAIRAQAVVVLKGADSVVAHPDGRAAIAPPASAWLASAGTGDVLAGITAAMLSRGIPPFEAAQAALWLHADAAARAGPGLIADDLAAYLPHALAACT